MEFPTPTWPVYARLWEAQWFGLGGNRPGNPVYKRGTSELCLLTGQQSGGLALDGRITQFRAVDAAPAASPNKEHKRYSTFLGSLLNFLPQRLQDHEVVYSNSVRFFGNSFRIHPSVPNHSSSSDIPSSSRTVSRIPLSCSCVTCSQTSFFSRISFSAEWNGSGATSLKKSCNSTDFWKSIENNCVSTASNEWDSVVTGIDDKGAEIGIGIRRSVEEGSFTWK